MSHLWFDHKVEIPLVQFESHSMAKLVCQRAHEFFNKGEYKNKGLSFMMSDGMRKTEVFICNSKVSEIDEATMIAARTLFKTYIAILEPFFPRLRKGEVARLQKELETPMQSIRRKLSKGK